MIEEADSLARRHEKEGERMEEKAAAMIESGEGETFRASAVLLIVME